MSVILNIILTLIIFKLKGYEVILRRVIIKKFKADKYDNLKESSTVLPDVGYVSEKVNHQSEVDHQREVNHQREVDQSVSTEPRF